MIKKSKFVAAFLLAFAASAQAQTAITCTSLDPTSVGCGIDAGAAAQNQSAAFGVNASAQENAVAVGFGAVAQEQITDPSASLGAVAVGSGAVGLGGVAVGAGALAYDRSVAIGNLTSTGIDAIAIGTGAAAYDQSVAIGVGSLATTPGTVSFGNAMNGETRVLQNVGAGVLPTDAVNMTQLADVDSKAVAALTGDAHDRIARAAAAAAQTTADSADAKAVAALTGDAHDRIARAAAAAAQTTADSADAKAVAALTGDAHDRVARQQISDLGYRVDDVDTRASQGTAAALASAAALPGGMDLLPGETAMGIGTGAYNGSGAIAFGLASAVKSAHPLLKGSFVRGSIAMTGGRPAVSAGVNWKW